MIIANTDADSAQALQDRTGIPVVVVPLNEGMFDDNVFQILSILGEVYHKEDRAEELADYLKGIQSDLAERTAVGALEGHAGDVHRWLVLVGHSGGALRRCV